VNQDTTSPLIKESQLKDWLGFQRRTDLENYLRRQNIPYLYGKGNRICTTADAINFRLIGKPAPAPEVGEAGEIEFE